MTHLTITRIDNQEHFDWNWDQLARDINTAIRRHEYSKLTKVQLEAKGRELGIDLDRRKKTEHLINQLIKAEFS